MQHSQNAVFQILQKKQTLSQGSCRLLRLVLVQCLIFSKTLNFESL
nr:MAG TPA: hypothetical protein [Caudoviricetes sp.]